MSIVRSVISEAVRSIVYPVTGLVGSVRGRFFTNFDAVAQSHILFDPIDLLDDDITVEVSFSTAGPLSGGTIACFYTADFTDIFGLSLDSGAFPKLFTNGNTPNKGTSQLNDGALHSMRLNLNRVTGRFSVYVDGLFEYSGVHADVASIATNYNICVGARYGYTGDGVTDQFFSGNISNVKVYSGNDLVFDAPIDGKYLGSINDVLESVSDTYGTFYNVSSSSSSYFNLRDSTFTGAEERWSGMAYKVGPASGSDLTVGTNYVEIERLDPNSWIGATFRGLDPAKNYVVSFNFTTLDSNIDLDDYGNVSVMRPVLGVNEIIVKGTNRLDAIMKSGAVGDRVVISDISIKELLTDDFSERTVRYFTNFDATTAMFVDLNQQLTLPITKPWSIEITAVVPTEGAYYFSDINSDQDKDRGGVLKVDDGRVFLPVPSSYFIGGNASKYHSDSILRKIIYWSDTNRIYMSIDGDLIHSANIGGWATVINSLGKKYAGSTGVPNFRGVMAKALITLDGEVVVDIDIDQKYSPTNNTIVNNGTGPDASLVNVTEEDSLIYELTGTTWVNGPEKTLENISE
ncbi:hypothetical protein ALT721_800059 [Alteromonas alvinellae]